MPLWVYWVGPIKLFVTPHSVPTLCTFLGAVGVYFMSPKILLVSLLLSLTCSRRARHRTRTRRSNTDRIQYPKGSNHDYSYSWITLLQLWTSTSHGCLYIRPKPRGVSQNEDGIITIQVVLDFIVSPIGSWWGVGVYCSIIFVRSLWVPNLWLVWWFMFLIKSTLRSSYIIQLHQKLINRNTNRQIVAYHYRAFSAIRLFP